MNQSISYLFNHAWSLIVAKSFTEGRISRGEYWISILLLSTFFGLVGLGLWILTYVVFLLPEGSVSNTIFASLSVIASLILPIIVAIIQVKLIIKRSHDLNKSGRYPYIPMLLLFICVLLALGLLWSIGFFSFSESDNLSQLIAKMQGNIGLRIVVVVGFASFLRSMARSIVIGFWKGSDGENNYGSNPLEINTTPNSSYWLLALILIIGNIIISFGSSYLQSMMFEDDTPGSYTDQYLNQGDTYSGENDVLSGVDLNQVN